MQNTATFRDVDDDKSYNKLFDAMQTLIISGVKRLLPPDFDYTPFKIIEQRPAKSKLQCGWIVYDLLNHFIRTLGDNIVSTYDYKVLEGQTQKLQAEVRGHIKLEQQIKLYIDSKSRASEKQRQQYKEIKHYVMFLQNKLKQSERLIRQKHGPLQKDTKATRSNLNLFKALLVADLQNKETVGKRPDKCLNRYDSQRSNSLQAYLSPRIELNLDLR